MAKRSKLNYDTKTLISNLKKSSGRGVDALFSHSSPTPTSTKLKTNQKAATVSKDKTERLNRSPEPNGRTERSNRTDIVNEKGSVAEKNLLRELKDGVVVTNKRPTIRYSFEIFVDQKSELEELQYQYKRRTGKRLNASRIIREALDNYFKEAKSIVTEDKKTER